MVTKRTAKLELLVIGVLMIMVGQFSSVSEAATTIIGSKHDFSLGATESAFSQQFQIGLPNTFGFTIDEPCVFCHTPHGASLDPQTNTLLWNRVAPRTDYTYKPYTSSTMSFGTPDTGDRRPTGISLMCMSCHDGVTSVAVGTLLNAPGSGNPQVSMDSGANIPSPGAISQGGAFGPNQMANIGNAFLNGPKTVDLSNDHPISFEWPLNLKDYYNTPQDGSLRLFGASGRRIECATCHLVHDKTIEPFLAMSNSQSAMCRACHIK